MRVAGYKLKGYDATYERAYFNVQEGHNASGNAVLEITDNDSGITFILEFDEKKKKTGSRKKWS